MAVLKKKKIVNTKKKASPTKRALVKRAKVTERVPAKKIKPILRRFAGNPIIRPGAHVWEERATLNPAASCYNNEVHLLYRAIGADDRSTLGYAMSEDGYIINERLDLPAYDLNSKLPPGVLPQIPYSSGGGTNGGCEDPRMAIIDNRVYVIYTAFDGWGSLRLTITSIDLSDFLEKRWRWSKPVAISPPGQINKNWVLFPEKINGKFVILHSIFSGIAIAEFDSLENYFNGHRFIENSPRYGHLVAGRWDSLVRGAGPPPLKTKNGWLLLYHAIDHTDPGRYKLGAMLLDLKDPTKIIFRCQQPILEPNAIYENQGFKSGIIYACGAVIKDDELIVYYGGADTVACVASANLNYFLKELIVTGRPTLKRRGVVRKRSA